MTNPLTPEQRADLAERMEKRAAVLWDEPERRVLLGASPHKEASVCAKLAREIRDGSFWEQQ